MAQVQIVTMALGLLIRMYMPRALGVDRIGQYFFAEAFPVLYFAFLGSGIDAFIRKTVPARPAVVGEAIWTILVYQLGLSAFLSAVLFSSMKIMGYDQITIYLVLVMGGYAAFLCIHRQILKQTFLSLHQYKLASNVELAVKIFLTTLTLLVLWLRPGLAILVWLTFASEALGAVWLFYELIRQKLIRFRFDAGLLKTILKSSLPFLAVTLFQELYANVDAAMLGRMAGNAELGFYGAATRLRGVFLMFLPVMANALMPIMAQTFSTSRQLYLDLVRDSMRTVMFVSFVLAVGLMCFADLGTQILYGADFAASARIVAYLAPIVPITYLAVLIATHLTVTTSGKAQAAIQFGSVAANALMNYYMIPLGLAHWGKGGGGVGASFASLITQALSALAMMFVTRSELSLMDRSTAKLFVVNAVPFGLVLWFFDEITTVPWVLRLAIFIPAVAVYAVVTGMAQRSDAAAVLKMIRRSST